ncbi:hypothetical protein VCSRO41_1798 [Vibrio cholerae]|nr:hypothetical protein VCSRO41_1798 [Vibrio cholerae]
MAVKKSVRIVDSTVEVLKVLSDESESINYSGAINRMAQEYELLVECCLPKLTISEKSILIETYRDHIGLKNSKKEIQMLHWNVSDCLENNEKLKDLIGGEESVFTFVNKVKEWSNSQKLAAIYCAQKSLAEKEPVESE